MEKRENATNQGAVGLPGRGERCAWRGAAALLLAALLSACGGGGASSDSPPATNYGGGSTSSAASKSVEISAQTTGSTQLQQTLSGSYTLADSVSGSAGSDYTVAYQWYAGYAADGSDAVAIATATAQIFPVALLDQYLGQYLGLGVTITETGKSPSKETRTAPFTYVNGAAMDLSAPLLTQISVEGVGFPITSAWLSNALLLKEFSAASSIHIINQINGEFRNGLSQAVSSFTLADVAAGSIFFFQKNSGPVQAPAFFAEILDAAGAKLANRALSVNAYQAFSAGMILWGTGSGMGHGDGGSASKTILGGAGGDVIFGNGSGGGAGTYWGARTGGSGDNTILGGAGDDLIFGNGFNGGRGTNADTRGKWETWGGYGGGGGGAADWWDHGKSIGGGGGGFWGGSDSWLGPVYAKCCGYFTAGGGVRAASGKLEDSIAVPLNSRTQESGGNAAGAYGSGVYQKVLYDMSLGLLGASNGDTVPGHSDTFRGLSVDSKVDMRLYEQGMGSGRNTIIGGPGNDWMMGGAGVNTFVWAAGDADGGPFFDRILDFNAAKGDTLWLADLLAAAGYQGSDALRSWVRLQTGTTAPDKLRGTLSRLEIDLTGSGFAAGHVDQTILFFGDPLAAYADAAALVSAGVLHVTRRDVRIVQVEAGQIHLYPLYPLLAITQAYPKLAAKREVMVRAFIQKALPYAPMPAVHLFYQLDETSAAVDLGAMTCPVSGEGFTQANLPIYSYAQGDACWTTVDAYRVMPGMILTVRISGGESVAVSPAVTTRAKLKVALVPVRIKWTDGNIGQAQQMSQTKARNLLSLLPVSQLELTLHDPMEIPDYRPVFGTNFGMALALVRELSWKEGRYDTIYGALLPDYGPVAGLAYVPGNAFVTTFQCNNSDTLEYCDSVFMHEIGHTLGRNHGECGNDPNPALLPLLFAPSPQSQVDSARQDANPICEGGFWYRASSLVAIQSMYHWQEIDSSFMPDPAAAAANASARALAAPAPYLAFSGTLLNSATGAPQVRLAAPRSADPARIAQAADAGDFELRISGAAGQILSRRFTPSALSEGDRAGKEMAFSVFLPQPSWAVVKAEIVFGGAALPLSADSWAP